MPATVFVAVPDGNGGEMNVPVPCICTRNRATGRHVREDTRARMQPRRGAAPDEARARVHWRATLPLLLEVTELYTAATAFAPGTR